MRMKSLCHQRPPQEGLAEKSGVQDRLFLTAEKLLKTYLSTLGTRLLSHRPLTAFVGSGFRMERPQWLGQYTVTLLSRSGRGTRSGHQTAAQSMGQFGEGVREWFEEQVKRSLSPDSTPESASPWTEAREASGMGATLSAKQQGEPATPNGQLHSLPMGS